MIDSRSCRSIRRKLLLLAVFSYLQNHGSQVHCFHVGKVFYAPRQFSMHGTSQRPKKVAVRMARGQIRLLNSEQNGEIERNVIVDHGSSEQITSHEDLVSTKAEAGNIPSYRKLIIFASSTILIWLSEPLLSLVDTTVVGLTQPNAVVQLASLGPATTFVDSMLYLTYFLAIATTNQLAKGLATKDYRNLQRTTSHVLGVAAVLGFAATAFAFFAGKWALTMMAGNSGTSELIHFATRYTWIRASAAVAAIVGIVMQAFCLATLDTKTPVVAVAAASSVNIVGDIALSHWGVQGAAVATAASNVVSTAILSRAVRRKMAQWRDEEQISTGKVNGSTKVNSPVETERTNGSGIEITQQESHAQIPLVSLPDRKSFIDLLLLSGPFFFVIVAKLACYSAMTLRCTDFGIVSLAAHNIMLRIFFFYATFGDSLSQTAQSFIPATLYPEKDKKSFGKIVRRLAVMACVISLINSQVSTFFVKHCGKYLTNNMSIIELMRSNGIYMRLSTLLHTFIMLSEGIVIASRDFRTLVATYVVTLGLHFGILNLFCESFPAVWRTFFLFQSIRLGSFGFQIWRRQASGSADKNRVVNKT